MASLPYQKRQANCQKLGAEGEKIVRHRLVSGCMCMIIIHYITTANNGHDEQDEGEKGVIPPSQEENKDEKSS